MLHFKAILYFVSKALYKKENDNLFILYSSITCSHQLFIAVTSLLQFNSFVCVLRLYIFQKDNCKDQLLYPI